MYRLPSLIALLVVFGQLLFGQSNLANKSPHGVSFKMDCILCHSTDGWSISPDQWEAKKDSPRAFRHTDTAFPLTGSHLSVNCKDCHTSLVFAEASTECVDCHLDVHQMSLGNDCARCHTTDFWLIDDIPELHEEVGFPLTGVHELLFCVDCHTSETDFRFERMGNDCISCHREDYEQTTSPDHQSLHFSFNCLECHTTDEGWDSGNGGFPEHDAIYFPIYSGTHEGVWTECLDCHTTPGDFTAFACTNCHLNPETSETHNGISGYAYEDNLCLACHPSGTAIDNFDHSLTAFPLTGAHIGLDCEKCHSNGYAGTSTYCFDCHQVDYQASANPDHASLNFPQNCASCHTTDPGWTPASFDIHDDYYVIQGAHIPIASDCAACHTNGTYSNTPNTCVGCHEGDYNETNNPNHASAGFPVSCEDCHSQNTWQPANFDHDNFYELLGAHAQIASDCGACHTNGNYSNTPNTCVGCHEGDYNGTNNPDHASAEFPITCEDCHSQDAWEPSTFDHDGDYFPIYSGKHKNKWDLCADCHINGSDYSIFSCIDCHEHDDPVELADKHSGVSGYTYESTACYSCHPTGDD